MEADMSWESQRYLSVTGMNGTFFYDFLQMEQDDPSVVTEENVNSKMSWDLFKDLVSS